MNEIVHSYETSNSRKLNQFLPVKRFDVETAPLEDAVLYAQQQQLSNILENAANIEEARLLLNNSSLANSAWQTEKWNSSMLETALAIAQKWKDGF